MKIGAKLKQLRLESSYTQEDVAEKIEISQANYSKLESNKMMPSGEVLPKLAKLYDISIGELFSSESAQQINYNNQQKQAINALYVMSDNLLVQQLLDAKDQIIKKQEEQIALLKQQAMALQNQ